jgi:hypothetical protein
MVGELNQINMTQEPENLSFSDQVLLAIEPEDYPIIIEDLIYS